MHVETINRKHFTEGNAFEFPHVSSLQCLPVIFPVALKVASPRNWANRCSTSSQMRFSYENNSFMQT